MTRQPIAVVTGAGSGIGRALTHALTRRGVFVVAADINQAGLDATKSDCPPGQVATHQLDVSDRSAMTTFADTVKREHGCASLVFNNAGVDLMASIVDMTWADYDWLTAINVGGVINGTKAFLPHLLETGSRSRPSRLINLSSAFGLIAMPHQGAYCASKFAVRGFTEALRQEMILERRPVTVHCVHPGVVRTNFGANMRIAEGDPDARRAAALFDRVAVTTADKAAQLILRGVDRNRARILVGPDGRAMAAAPRLLGAGYAALIAYTARYANARTWGPGR